MAANRFFDDQMLAVLGAPERWRLISSQNPADVRPLEKAPAARRRWSHVHAHSHPRPEFLLVLKGTGVYGFHEELYPFGPGTAFYFDSMESHDQGYPTSAPDTVHLWITVLPDRIFTFVTSWHRGRLRSAGRVRCVLLPHLVGVQPAVFLRDPAESAALPPKWRKARLLAALHAIVTKAVEKGFEPAEDGSDRERFQAQVMEAVQGHIRETSGRGLTLDSLARIAGYSKFHFLRLFQRHTGKSVLEYVNQCRVETVRRMRAEGRSHKEIGSALGFSCPASFSRWYTHMLDSQE